MNKRVSQEVEWINRWEIRTLIHVLTTGKGIPCLVVDVLIFSTRPPWLLLPLTTKGRDPAITHGDRITLRPYILSGQYSFVLCNNPVDKGITTMLCRTKPVIMLLLGDSKHFLCIMVVNMVPECVVNKLAGVRGGTKYHSISRAVYIGSFR